MKPYYEDQAVTLYLGDCREVTAWLDADVLVTDPPYGTGGEFGYGKRSVHNPTGGSHGLFIANDQTTEVRDDALRAWDREREHGRGDGSAVCFCSPRLPEPPGPWD